MRLLQTKTLELHEFFGANIPPYAILSHTWGDGEVSFQEMQSDDAKSKAGYDKILHCCQMAAADGFHYTWVDTCCIDKTSSAELSEAINSMYQWYRFSEVCYVWLADVPANLKGEVATQAFRKSRWFTRGWTLQELIAPPSVIFFDNEWQDIGTKESLQGQIMEITMIQGEVLEDAEKRYKLSVAQKMSWASKRETTRAEDIAYCLLGIFGVNMPMLYGEGNHAFIRLQEEIMRKTNDHSIFAWADTRDTSGISAGLLTQTPAGFSGSGNIVQSQGQATSPFSLTNKGILLHLRTKNWKSSTLSLAVLDCQEGENEGKRLGIYMETEPEGADLFRRVLSNELVKIDETEIPKLKWKDFFVKQRRIIERIPRYNNHYVAIEGLEAHGIVLHDSYPGTVHKSGSSKLSNATATKTKMLNVLRFLDRDGGFFVVVVKSEWKWSSLTANIFEHGAFFRLANPPNSRYDKPDRLTLNQWLEKRPGFKEYWNGNESERVYWQHPVKKWWISLMTKRNMVHDERRKTVHISWHTPQEKEPVVENDDVRDIHFRLKFGSIAGSDDLEI